MGGAGQDVLGGGADANVFVFSNTADSPLLTRDQITDFEDGVDMIDLSDFVGTLSFVASYTGTAGEVRYNDSLGRLYIDVDGDRSSDFAVDTKGAPTIDAADLILKGCVPPGVTNRIDLVPVSTPSGRGKLA